MNYYDAIIQAYPGITSDDFELSDAGDGKIYLSKWAFSNKPPKLDTLAAKAKQLSDAKMLELEAEPHKQYLKDTDWYIVRAMEDPTKVVPQDIIDKRALARSAINGNN